MTDNTSAPLACLEHLNLTVSDPDALANLFCDLFGWRVRWSGLAKDDGYTVHVGSDNRYLALYTHDNVKSARLDHLDLGTINHVGLVVTDAEAMEQRIIDAGFKTQSHRDYGVCKSFYFMADKRLEIEIVCYSQQ